MLPKSVLLENPAALCNIVRRIAIEAGATILQYFDDLEVLEVDQKHDESPVTLADRDAEKVITKGLLDILPNVPIIGEEATAQGKITDLSNAEYFWLVDPLDGTREFIKGGNEFTVNIALIKDKVPVLGIIYAPARGILYAAHGGDTAIRWSDETNKDKPISVRPLPREGLTIVASRSHGDPTKLDKFLEQFKINKMIRRGSALKICSVAEGSADLYPRFGPTCEWDTAAGDAIIRAAGGMITDVNGKPLVYGGANPKFLNPEFIASSFAWYEL